MGGTLKVGDECEPGVTLGLGDASEAGGTNDSVSAPATSLQVLEREFPTITVWCLVTGDKDRAMVTRLGGNDESGHQRAKPGRGTGLHQSDRARWRSQMTHALLVKKAAGRQSTKQTDWLVQNPEQTPTTDHTTPSSTIRVLR